MAILIGGSPSTGSSLLRRILNRHSRIFCGPETALFTKKKLYEDWETNKQKLFRKSFAGLVSMGWHHLRGIQVDEGYGMTQDEVKQLILAHQSFPEFVDAFYKVSLTKNEKDIWAEKTPANVFAFDMFANQFSDVQLIHIVRDPRDTIASLVERGKDPFNAVALYLINTGIGCSYEGPAEKITVKYENLVETPRMTVSNLCQFLGVEFEEKMIEAEEPEGVDYMEGWNYRETGTIEKGSVGRYHSLDEEIKANVDYIIEHLRSSLSEEYESIGLIAHRLNYDLSLYSKYNPRIKLISAIRKDRMKRRLQAAYFNHTNYPLYVR